MFHQANEQPTDQLEACELISQANLAFSLRLDLDEEYYSTITTQDSETNYSQSSFTMQGVFQYIGSYESNSCFQEGQPDQFKEIVNRLRMGDFSTLAQLWSQKFIKKLEFIVDNWNQYCITYQDHFENLLKVFKENIDLFTYRSERKYQIKAFYNNFYPRLISTLQKIERKTEIRGGQLKPIMPLTDQLKQKRINNNMMRLFVREQQLKANKMGICYIDIKPKKNQEPPRDINQTNQQILKPLSSLVQNQKKKGTVSMGGTDSKQIGHYIVEQNIFANNTQEWKTILFKAAAVRRYNKASTPHLDIHKQIEKAYEFSQLILNNNEMTQPVDRLCCARFFYFGMDVSPVNRQHLLIRKELFQLKQNDKKSDKHKKKKQNRVATCDRAEFDDIMLDLCALLNSGGGVLLFSCQKQYLQIRPMGQLLLEGVKPKYVEMMAEQIKKIYPKVKMDREIVASFVPMVKHPYDQGYKREVFSPQDRQLNREYIKGQYVMRIVANPSQSERLYCLQIDKNQAKSAVVQNNKRKVLNGSEISSLMTQKYNFFEMDSQDQEESQLLSKDYSYSAPHQCLKPYRGDQLEMKEQLRPGCENVSKYAYVSLLVANRKHFEVIEKRLKQKGIDCWINTEFQKYSFEATAKSAPLHHNQRFDKLLNLISYNPDFMFDKRPVLIINCTHCLKLKNRIGQDKLMPIQDFKQLGSWLQKQFPQQKLQYWRIANEDGEIEHFLRLQNKLAVIFMYFLLQKFNEKSMLKNPGGKGQENQQYKKIINARAKRAHTSDNDNTPFFPDV